MAKTQKVNKPKFELDIPAPPELEPTSTEPPEQPKQPNPEPAKPEQKVGPETKTEIQQPIFQPTEKTKKDHESQEPLTPEDSDPKTEQIRQETENSFLRKYKKEPKYKTHVPHNTRIPRELRKEMEKIAKKLGIPINKNSGFFQQFTIDALWAAVEKAKKELGID